MLPLLQVALTPGRCKHPGEDLGIQRGKEARHLGRSNSEVMPRVSVGDAEMRYDLGEASSTPTLGSGIQPVCTSSVKLGPQARHMISAVEVMHGPGHLRNPPETCQSQHLEEMQVSKP